VRGNETKNKLRELASAAGSIVKSLISHVKRACQPLPNSTSSFRSCPIQLWIRGTILVEAKMANITQPNRTDKGNENYSFRCADAGFTGCSWEAKGSSPDDVLRQAEQHGREQHNMTSINDETRDKVRSKIRHAA
jgi:predicted small metal-binding protein